MARPEVLRRAWWSTPHSAEQIAAGIAAIVNTIRAKSPTRKILLLGIFPRGPQPGTPVREKLAEVNGTISGLDDGKHVHYLDDGRQEGIDQVAFNGG